MSWGLQATSAAGTVMKTCPFGSKQGTPAFEKADVVIDMFEDVRQKKRVTAEVGCLARVRGPDESNIGVGGSGVGKRGFRCVDSYALIAGSKARDVGAGATADVEQTRACRHVGFDGIGEDSAARDEPPVIPLDPVVQFELIGLQPGLATDVKGV